MTRRSQRVLIDHAAEMAYSDGAIPLFAEITAHSSVPLDEPVAAAHSDGQERPQAGACALLLTGASTAARSRSAVSSSTRLMSIRRTVIGLIVVMTMSIAYPSVAQNLSATLVAVAVSQSSDPYAPYVTEASRRFGIPDSWIRAVMQIESADAVRAVSKRGALGLMQIMPATWRELQSRYGLGPDPYDPHDNIIAGAAYLREMYDRFGPTGFLAAYNAGPDRYQRSRNEGLPLPAETQRYLAILKPVIDGLHSAPIDWAGASGHPRQSSLLFANTTIAVFDTKRTPLAPLSTPPSRDAVVVDLSALVPTSRDMFVVHSRGNNVP